MNGNQLLAGLAARDRAAVLAAAEHAVLLPGQVMATRGSRILQVLFPLEGFIAMEAESDRGRSLAVSLVGSEGVLGAPLALGSRLWPLRAQVLGAGSALRIRAGEFEALLRTLPALNARIWHQLARQYGQLGRASACVAFHHLERRLARWLLMIHDRAHGDRFVLTHRQLARVLGVRRGGVTVAAGALQARMLIGYTRGHVVIRDRAGLEGAACSCYDSPRGRRAGPGFATPRATLRRADLRAPAPRPAPGA